MTVSYILVVSEKKSFENVDNGRTAEATIL